MLASAFTGGEVNPPKRLRTTELGGDEESGSEVDVSIIMPVYNASCWLDECLQAILQQDFTGTMQLSVFDDASTDDSRAAVEGWRERLEARGISVVMSGHNSAHPKGVGYAKNKAVSQSCGRYLCFQDADDIMLPERVRMQYEAAVLHPSSLIGCKIQRIPEGSTERYTRWINTISQDQLVTQHVEREEEVINLLHLPQNRVLCDSDQTYVSLPYSKSTSAEMVNITNSNVYTSHGPTVIMPTWFCSRSWFLDVGPFDEGGKGVPEDLLFFYQSIRGGGGVLRVDHCLLVYRYHEKAATHSVTEETIWKLRVDFLQERVLNQWENFTIWNAGKQGRKLYRSLSPANQKKVRAFCDVDENKIRKGFYTHEESKQRPKPKVPILHYTAASAPLIVCVKLDMTGGILEDNLNSLHLKEGSDYYHFN